MKLALVSPYDFAFPGGVTSHVAHLAEQFRLRGHEVHIIAPSSDDEMEPEIAEDSFVHRIGRVVSIPANGSVARITVSPRQYLQVKTLLRQQQFDLIPLHEPMMPALPLSVLRHSNTTNVGTFHAFRAKPLAYYYGKGILQPFFKKLHGRIVVSDAARQVVSRYFPAEYRVIPNGIDFACFNTPLPRLHHLRDGRPNVLFVGRFEKLKGLRFLLRAWSQVRAAVPEARLVVVGEGRPMEGYRRFAHKQGWSEDDVRFTGYVSAEDLPRYYQAASLFCAPSTGQESFGIVLLEAMASGVPIVASDIPGYRDVVTDGQEGVLVGPKDSPSLAEAITQLLNNPARRAAMADAGPRTARQYDWTRVADRVLAYYGEVLHNRVQAPEPRPARFARVRRMAGLLAPRT
jgi:phosphatidylinositol alpha-mannosyltransferase